MRRGEEGKKEIKEIEGRKGREVAKKEEEPGIAEAGQTMDNSSSVEVMERKREVWRVVSTHVGRGV